MKDLRSKEGGVWVRRGKDGKPRLAGMDPESFEALGPWFELRAEQGLEPGGPVFWDVQRDSGAVELRAPHERAAAVEARALETGACPRAAAYPRARVVGAKEAVAVVRSSRW